MKTPVPVKTEGISGVPKVTSGERARRDPDTKREEKALLKYREAEKKLERTIKLHAGGRATSQEIDEARGVVKELWAKYLELKGIEKAVRHVSPTNTRTGEADFSSKHIRKLYLLFLKKGLEFLKDVVAMIEQRMPGLRVNPKMQKGILEFPIEKAIKPLTENEVDKLVQEIQGRAQAFNVNFAGAEIEPRVEGLMRRRGKILRDKFSFPRNAYAFQRINDIFHSAGKDPDKVSFKQMLSMAKRIPLTSFEKDQVSYLERQAAKYVTGLGEGISATLHGTMEEASQILRYRGLIKQEAKQAVINRWGWKNLSRELGKMTGDWARDWDRIARTEIQDAVNDAAATKIAMDNKGEDPLVFKRPRASACKYCLALYTHGNDISRPKIFHLSTLVANGTNKGRKVGDWMAVKDTLHAQCQCTIHEFVGTMTGKITTGPGGDIVAEETHVYGVVKPKIKDQELAEALSRVQVNVDGIPIEELR
jgi:hypothetical protein